MGVGGENPAGKPNDTTRDAASILSASLRVVVALTTRTCPLGTDNVRGKAKLLLSADANLRYRAIARTYG
jgi:hypothetical protein